MTDFKKALESFDAALKVLRGLDNDVALCDFFDTQWEVDAIRKALEIADRMQTRSMDTAPTNMRAFLAYSADNGCHYMVYIRPDRPKEIVNWPDGDYDVEKKYSIKLDRWFQLPETEE